MESLSARQTIHSNRHSTKSCRRLTIRTTSDRHVRDASPRTPSGRASTWARPFTCASPAIIYGVRSNHRRCGHGQRRKVDVTRRCLRRVPFRVSLRRENLKNVEKAGGARKTSARVKAQRRKQLATSGENWKKTEKLFQRLPRTT